PWRRRSGRPWWPDRKRVPYMRGVSGPEGPHYIPYFSGPHYIPYFSDAPVREASLWAQIGGGREGRGPPVLCGLLVCVSEFDQFRLAPCGAEERHPERQPPEVPHRYRDVRITGDRGDGRGRRRGSGAAVAVHEVDEPCGTARRRHEG